MALNSLARLARRRPGKICFLAGWAVILAALCLPLPEPRVQGAAPGERPGQVQLTGTGGNRPAETRPATRAREGTILQDRPGLFQPAGDRLIFVSEDGQQRLVTLENLNLERIARTIGDRTTPLHWTVTGTITEYRGGNYLLVERATLHSGTHAAVPSQRVADRMPSEK